MNTRDDEKYMRMALEEADGAYGLSSPNPIVGAVVVKDGQVVGRGHNTIAGLPHAEPNALDDAGELARGATLYVTLEPCSTTGRTPPCTERILRSGVSRVVIGATDSNPRHCGAGIRILKEAGLEVTCGILEDECRAKNEDFFWWISRKRPFVILKMAMTLDGKIATQSGDSKWVTGEKARSHVQWLRRGSDAIMVGGETFRLDAPSLTVREPAGWNRQPRKFIWSNRTTAPDAESVKPVTSEEWLAFLRRLGAEDAKQLLLEGGGELAAAALNAGIVNQVQFFIAPKILGGRASRPVVGGNNPLKMADALDVEIVSVKSFGEDLLITGNCRKCLQD